MPRVQRTATAAWEGNVARGTGQLSTESGVLREAPFSLPARIGNESGKTNPEELLGAAHAGCLAMSLANQLAQAGTPPERLEVRATVVLDEVNGSHRIVASHVEIQGRVPDSDDASFRRAVEEADEGCTFSALIRASAEVTVEAQLSSERVGAAG